MACSKEMKKNGALVTCSNFRDEMKNHICSPRVSEEEKNNSSHLRLHSSFLIKTRSLVDERRLFGDHNFHEQQQSLVTTYGFQSTIRRRPVLENGQRSKGCYTKMKGVSEKAEQESSYS